METVVRGRNVEVPEHYRDHVAEKLERLERYDHKLIRIDVELYHERNRRQADICQRVEITCVSRGPVIRSEACDADFYSALDAAVSRLESRLRRSADRRRVHHGRHTPSSVRAGAGVAVLEQVARATPDTDGDSAADIGTDIGNDIDDDDGPGRVVREKQHTSEPMGIDQALHEMELVGHDFYLFQCRDSGRPSVVYRRKGYDYGVIRLAAEG